MRLRIGFPSVIFALSFVVPSLGQAPAPDTQASVRPALTAQLSATLQPVLSDVQSTTAALNVARWKAPGSVRAAAQQNIDSIQRDLGNALPNLIAQADAAPGSVPPAFAVYRNLDALYDVLLRVSETADLAAPQSDAVSIASSLQRLEAARSQLGDSIVSNSQHNEAQVVALEAAVRTAKAAPAPSKRETVVDDGPSHPAAQRAKRKTAAKKPTPKSASKPANGSPSSGSSL